MGTHYHGTEEEIKALELYIKLSRAADTFTNIVNLHLKEHDLTISQFGVLESLYHLGPMHQNLLAEKILKSSGNMTLVIDNLVKRGCVERVRDQADRRYINIHLTDFGKALIKELFPKHVAGVVQAASHLTIEEQAQLTTLCRKLGLSLS